MAYMQQRHFQQQWRSDVHVTIHTFLLPLFCISISYLSHSDCLVVILKFYTVPVFLKAVTNFANDTAFSSKHLSTFLPRKYDVISQLRHSYAEGPFCVARLKWLFTLTFYQQDGFYLVLSIFCILYQLIKGMCPKICGNWVLPYLFISK